MFVKCKCGSEDAAAGSVKVDTAALERRRQEEQEEREQEERVRVARELEEEKRRRADEEQRDREEQRRQEEEEEEGAERPRRAEEERLRRTREERLQREEEQRAKEAKRRRREEEVRLEDEARRKALSIFYARNGFAGANAPRRAGCSVLRAATTYPLHCAAEMGDERVAAMLLKEGADKRQKDSSGRTALQVAQKKNKGGSHEGVLRVLGGAIGSPCTGGA